MLPSELMSFTINGERSEEETWRDMSAISLPSMKYQSPYSFLMLESILSGGEISMGSANEKQIFEKPADVNSPIVMLSTSSNNLPL